MSQPPPVVIQFAVRGLDDVQRAIKGIAETAAGTERKSVASAKATASAEVKAAKSAAVAKAVLANESARNSAAASRAGLRRMQALWKEEERAHARSAAKILSDAAKAEASKVKEAERSAAAMNRIRERSATMAGKYAAQQVKDEQRTAQQRAQIIKGQFGRGVGNAIGIIKGGVGGAMNAMGGFSVPDALQSEIQLQGKAASLAASSEGHFTADGLLSSARKTGIQYGFDPADVLSAMDEVKKLTGKTQVGIDTAPFLAKLANASGADLGELGGLAGNILAGSPDIKRADLERQLAIFTQQGMAGGVEVGDLAKYGGRITAGAGYFGGNREANETTLGAFAQIARQYGGASSAAEAALAAQRFGSDTAKKADHLKGMGIDVSDGNGTMRSPEELAIEMVRKTKGDITQLGDLKLGERANKVLYGLADIYRTKGGGEEGEKAIRAEVGKYRGALSGDEIDQRNAQRMAAVDKQVTAAMTELKQVVGSQLVPELTHFIRDGLIPAMPAIKDTVHALSKLASTLIDHPIAGVGAIIVASVAKDVASAAIGEALKKALLSVVPGGGGGTPGGGGMPGVVGGAVAAGAATAAVIYGAGTKYADGTENAENLAAKLQAYLRGDTTSGTSPEKAMGIINAAKARLGATNAFTQAGNIIASPFSDKASADYKQFKADQAVTDNENLKKAITDAIAQGFDATRGDPRSNPGNGNHGPIGARTRPQ